MQTRFKTIFRAAALAALALFGAAAAPAQAQDAAWRRVPLDAGASAEFPGQPQAQPNNGNPGLVLLVDGGTLYQAAITPAALPSGAGDSARTAFYQSQVAAANLGDKLLSQRATEVAGAPGYEFAFKTAPAGGEVSNVARLVVLGDKLYFLAFGSRTPDEAATVANRERFLGSLRAGAVSAEEASAATTAAAAAPADAGATPEKRSPFSPTTIIAGILGGLGALWLIRRRAAQAAKANQTNPNQPNQPRV